MQMEAADVTQAFLPHLTCSRGAIVNILSTSALAPLPLIPAYSISKAAVAIPWKRGDFLIADSCNFSALCEYRTPVHMSVLASVMCAVGMRVTGRAAPRGGAGWGLPVSPA